MPSFWNALRRWYATVFTPTTSSPAISRSVRPADASRATTSSWDVSTARSRSPRGAGRSPDPASSGLAASHPRPGAEGRERLAGRREQIDGAPPLAVWGPVRSIALWHHSTEPAATSRPYRWTAYWRAMQATTSCSVSRPYRSQALFSEVSATAGSPRAMARAFDLCFPAQ
jgi:hypothetical protein